MQSPDRKILLLNGDPDIEAELSTALRKSGYTVHRGRDTSEGLFQLVEWVPDVVLVDVSDPSMGGLEFCKEARARSRVQIIAFSAEADPTLVIRALEAGADDCVPKPFSLAVVQARIRARFRHSVQYEA